MCIYKLKDIAEGEKTSQNETVWPEERKCIEICKDEMVNHEIATSIPQLTKAVIKIFDQFDSNVRKSEKAVPRNIRPEMFN